jgi:hypothetical protein
MPIRYVIVGPKKFINHIAPRQVIETMRKREWTI